MPLAAFSDNFALYDVTPVENIFLLEYMPYAQGDAVRVYLYGLMLCRFPGREDTVDSMAAALNMKPEQVLSALRYWERKGLVEGMRDNPPEFRYLNVRSAMIEQPPEGNPAYAYGDFNNRLQEIFGLLHPQQFRMAMEWVEDMHLPTDVVLYMVEQVNALMTLRNGGKQRTAGYCFKVLKDRAIDWAARGIDTIEKARQEISRELPPHQVSRNVLDKLGMRRNPTSAEVALCGKWLGEWGYDEAGILDALKETTKSANPSFAYLDGILAGRRGHADADVRQAQDARDAVKRVLEALGAPSRTPTQERVQEYEALLRQGFAPETVLRAAALCNSKGHGTFEKLKDVLAKWLLLGLTTPGAVDAYLERRAVLRTLTLSVLDKAGVGREPTEADLDQVQQWLRMAPGDVIEYAASLARGLKLPERSIAKRLGEFSAAGITTVEAAAAFKRPAAAREGAAESRPAALKYAQRKYEDGFFDDFFADLSAHEGKDAP